MRVRWSGWAAEREQWCDQEWAKKRPYLGNRREAMAKEWASLDEKQVGGKEGARSSPAEGKKRATRGSRKGRGRQAIGGIRKQVGKWEVGAMRGNGGGGVGRCGAQVGKVMPSIAMRTR